MMASEKNSATPKRGRSPVSSHRSSSPGADRATDSPNTGSMDVDDEVESPDSRARASSPASNERRRLPSITKTLQLDSPSDICLCQPDPKVPRPRNAFILYRQHYQAAVVAQNPGLANPEISKVIGEQWRDASLEVKSHWKSLADEEKLRHQKQHPGYRYQPRRSARTNSISSPQTTPLDPPRCTKCGRKTITSSPLPSSTYTPSATHTPTTPHAPSLHTPPPSRPGQHLTPRQPPPSAGFKSTAALLASPRSKRPSFSQGKAPSSPDSKRRRVIPPGPVPIYHTHGLRHAGSPSTPFFPPQSYPPQHQQRRDSLPGPPSALFLPRPSGAFNMGPPPRPGYHYQHPPSPMQFQMQGQDDGGLTLPPIQTQIQLQSLRDREREEGHRDAQARGLRAMIHSIGAIGKIKTLARIAPPMEHPASGRGAVIAVEGEGKSVTQVAEFLKGIVEKGSSNRVRMFSLPEAERDKKDDEEERTFAEYHTLVQRYLRLSHDVAEFVTSPAPPSSPPPTPMDTSPPYRGTSERDSPVSPKTMPVPNPPRSSPENQGKGGGIPIAILPRYQLSQADTFACAIPIADAYSPADHWQWMASLWRGAVGPDLTIAVRPWAVDTSPGAGGTRGNGKDGRGAGQNVEVRIEDARAVVLRVGKEGEVGEGGLRRVGFEVGEWVRGRGG